jgi:ribonucleoside-diphosphate reductase alpha chain
MYVKKRNGRGNEPVYFDKITDRISKLCTMGNKSLSVEPALIAQLTIAAIYNGISTNDIDIISADKAEAKVLDNADYGVLASRILVSNMHKNTPSEFSACMNDLSLHNLLSEPILGFIAANAGAINGMIDHSRDYLFDYMGLKTMENSYLMKISGVMPPDGSPNTILWDRPQYQFMRVAIQLHTGDLSAIKATYDSLSKGMFIHATPTLYNSCCMVPQLNSCFLLGTHDSIEGIMNNATKASLISKRAGGIGIHVHNIRPAGTKILGTGGVSNGIVRQLKILNECANCWNQGGRRPGSFAIYLEPWHGDIMAFLQLKLQQGADEVRARDLFYGLWVPDLFMKRGEENLHWTLFSETSAPGLSDVYDGMSVCKICGWCPNPAYAKYVSEASIAPQCAHIMERRPVFTELYTKYEREGRGIKRIPVREIQSAIFRLMRESGTPYICYKDAVNRMSSQDNIGTIKSSNLCTEIVEYSSDTSYACCTLASINLRAMLVDGYVPGAASAHLQIDHGLLADTVRHIVLNLDRVIDINEYPVSECEGNSHDYRPIGIGVQGLANLFMVLRIPYISDEAARVDLEIFETIYYAALTESCAQAKLRGPHVGFWGSPAASGRLHFDLYLEHLEFIGAPTVNVFSGRYDWGTLKTDIIKYGLRHSHHIALMPTVTTSRILNNIESFEPISSNIGTKTTGAGTFTRGNVYMIEHLRELGLWDDAMRILVTNSGGSIADLNNIPQHVRDIYKTVYEIKQTDIIARAALRAAYVDQAMSLNIHLRDNSDAALRTIMYRGWKAGLKTGSYYHRTKPAVEPMKNNNVQLKAALAQVCTREEGCTMCYS